MAKHIKVILFAAALLFFICLLPACSGHSSSAVVDYLSESQDDSKSLEDDLKLAWSPADEGEEYYSKVTAGFEEYCDEMGYTALIADPSNSREEQYSEIENWIAMGADAIAAAPVDAQYLEDIVESAREAGIITGGFYKKIQGADFNYALDEYDLGYIIGQNASKWIEEKLNGRANLILMLNDSDEFLRTRGSGIRDVLESLDDVRIVDEASVDSVPDAKVAADSLLGIHLGVNVIVCISDEYAIGILEVTRDLDIENENLYIGGAGYTDEAVREMNENGSYFRSTVNLSPEEAGRLLAQMMAKAVVGGVENDTVFFEPQSYWQNLLNWN